MSPYKSRGQLIDDGLGYIERDIIEDMGDGEVAMGYISPLSIVLDAASEELCWPMSEEEAHRLMNEYEYEQIPSMFDDFEWEWDAKMRQQKREANGRK